MRHEPQSRRFVNTLGDGRVILKLQSACDALDDAQVVWRSGSAEREETLQRLGSVNGNEFFSVTIVPNVRPNHCATQPARRAEGVARALQFQDDAAMPSAC